MLVLGAESGLVEEALSRAGPDGDVIVVDPTVGRLERLQRIARDPRVWFLIGDGDVLPLPDGSVDAVLGEDAETELARVLREQQRAR